MSFSDANVFRPSKTNLALRTVDTCALAIAAWLDDLDTSSKMEPDDQPRHGLHREP